VGIEKLWPTSFLAMAAVFSICHSWHAPEKSSICNLAQKMQTFIGARWTSSVKNCPK
jgi:hypothetical protein